MTSSENATKLTVAFTCVVAAGAVAAVALFGGTLDLRDVAVILAFAPFVIIAANLDVLARGGVGMSGAAMLFIGAIVAFERQECLFGVLIVAACFGLDYQQIRQGEWLKVAFNVAASMLAVLL